MRTSKTKKQMTIRPPAKSAFSIESDPYFIKLHTLTLVSGKRGGGKSVATANLIRIAKEKNYIQRCWLITPTYASNKEIWSIANIDEDDVMEPDMNCIKTLIKNVENEREEWELFLKQKSIYEKFHREIKNKPIKCISPDELLFYHELGLLDGNATKPEWKYDVECPPRLAVIIDDSLGTDLMARRTAGLVNLCIRHRHLADGLGISIFMLVQSYCAQGGVARPIRENCTNLLLFKINDSNQIKKIKEEADLPVSDEDFQNMCDYCHAEPYQFMLVDFSPKDENKRFRRGFDEYLMPPSLNNRALINQ